MRNGSNRKTKHSPGLCPLCKGERWLTLKQINVGKNLWKWVWACTGTDLHWLTLTEGRQWKKQALSTTQVKNIMEKRSKKIVEKRLATQTTALQYFPFPF
jgi:hypothetical protein